MIKMAVFDMAGTTIQENNIVYKTLCKVINDFGFNVSLSQVLTIGAGKEKLTAIKDIISNESILKDDSIFNKIYESFISELNTAYEQNVITAQDGAEELFSALRKKNILVVLNTGYNESTALNILQKIGWQVGVDIDGLITASQVSKNRPNPDMIILAMQKFGIADPNQVVKIGDSIIDIEEGKNAGCRLSIGITTGAHTQEQLLSAYPDYVVHKLTDLLSIL